MLTYVDGSLFLSPAQVLVNTVNTVGVMGKGIAKDFKYFFPEMFREYQIRCENNSLDIGKLYLYRGSRKWVLNFPTKKHWRNPSRPEYIEAGLRTFVAGYERSGITSIAFPQLGCGNGELDWENQVQPLVERYLGRLPIDVFVHHFRRADHPEHHDIEGTRAWLRSEPETLAFTEVWDDLQRMVGSGRELRAIGNGHAFSTRVTESSELGLIIDDGEQFLVRLDSLLETWQTLRAAGFITAASLPDGLDDRAGEVLAVLTSLPYVRHVQVSQCRIDRPGEYRDAVQLVPRPASGAKRTTVVHRVEPS
jgi:O-acetyl-ADP-ribose deacetylase (regulator of RNase III)